MHWRGSKTRRHAKGTDPRWVRKVATVSTFPPPGLFNRDAETIARVMATKKVSPRGIGSGIRMIQFFIDRAGKHLPARRRRELERGERILQERRAREEERAWPRTGRRRNVGTFATRKQALKHERAVRFFEPRG
jgi:hypothetical protein